MLKLSGSSNIIFKNICWLMECADEVCGNPDINKDLRKRKAKMFYGVVHEIKIV